MIPGRFEYFRPNTLEEAVSFLSENQDDAKVLAGGQSLVSVLKLRMASPEYLIDLNGLDDLRYIREEADGTIAIGAMTTYAQVKDSKILQTRCPLLPETAAVVGDVQIRNRGTIGGCIAHADPAGDVPASVLALGARLKAVGPEGERWFNVEDFFLGMYATELAPDEILTEIRIPDVKDRKFSYLKAARRPSDFAIVGISANIKLGADNTCEEICIGVTGVTDKPYRPQLVEEMLTGTKLEPKAIAAAAPAITQDIDVISNIHAGSDFRTHLARVYLSRVIQSAK